eukprot:CFRG6030T1
MAMSPDFAAHLVKYNTSAWLNHSVLCCTDEYYKQTILFNSYFKHKTVHKDLMYVDWTNPPTAHPHTLTTSDELRALKEHHLFARKIAPGSTLRYWIMDNLLCK